MFDKDVGYGEGRECDCGDDVGVWCTVCQGRKQLLRDLRGMKRDVSQQQGSREVDEGVGMEADRCNEKTVRLCTIVEGEEED